MTPANPLGPQVLPQPGRPVQPKAGPDMKIYDPAQPQYQSAIPQSVDPMRQRLAEAVLKATTPPADQPVQHPLQALGNASSQIAGAYLQKKAMPRPGEIARTSPLPGSPTVQPRGGPGPAYYSGAKKPMPQPRPLRPGQPLRQMGASVKPGGITPPPKRLPRP